MHVLLGVLAGVAGAGALVLSLSLGFVFRRFRRANRLVPHRRTHAPMSWRWSPRRAAQLHRRLQRACALLLTVTDAPQRRCRGLARRRRGPDRSSSVLGAAAEQLLERALQADAQLVDVDRRGPAWRRVRLPTVASEVRAVEAAALRLTNLRAELDATVSPQGLASRAEDLLDAFEAALADLRRPEARPELFR